MTQSAMLLNDCFRYHKDVNMRVPGWFITLLLLSQTPAAFAVLSYTVAPIATPPGVFDIYPVAVNNAGQAALNLEFLDPTKPGTAYMLPYLYQSGIFTALPVPSGDVGYVSAINADGTIVGSVGTSDTAWLPAVWKNQSLALLDIGAYSSGQVAGINSQGVIVGTLTTAGNYQPQPVYWDQTGMNSLGDFGALGVARSINDAGQILISVPDATAPFQSENAVIYQNGNLTTLNNNGLQIGAAISISSNGDVAGYAITSQAYQAVIWKNGVAQTLPYPDAYTQVFPTNSDDAGQILAFEIGGLLGNNALLYVNDQYVYIDSLLTDTSWADFRPFFISPNGIILVTGSDANGDVAALLIPAGLPEPASALLLSAAPFLLLFRARRR